MNVVYMCFPEGRKKALTLSYDDGRQADKKLINVFNNYNIKVTFHLNSGKIDINNQTEDDLKYGLRIAENEINQIYSGHEVAAHTCNHLMLDRCSEIQILNEILEDRKNLEKIVGYPVKGFSYPYGSYNETIKKILLTCGIEYSRIVGNSCSFDLPLDFFEWKPTCHHNYKLIELTEKFLSLGRKQNLYLFYVWGHSYEFDKDNNWDLIYKFAEKMGNRKDIWYASNIEIVDYIKAFKRLKFSADMSFVYNPSVKPVYMSVNDRIYEIEGGKQIYFK